MGTTHVFEIPYFTFKLYNNIVVPSWVALNGQCPKRRVVETYFRFSKKVSMT